MNDGTVILLRLLIPSLEVLVGLISEGNLIAVRNVCHAPHQSLVIISPQVSHSHVMLGFLLQVFYLFG